MAPLTNPHWAAVPDAVRIVLARLENAVELSPFYLAGGTALALQLGHRLSVDLDFFGAVETFSESWQRRLVSQLANAYRVDSISYSPFGLNLKADGIAVGFLTYGYPLLEPLVQLGKIELASIADIGLMKIDAVASRGTRKDFYDLYFITRQVPLVALFERGETKFSLSRQSKENLVTALIDFDVAETFPEPLLLTQVSWNEVKTFFKQEVAHLSHIWLD